MSLISEGQKLAPSLEPAVRLYVESLAEQLIATTCTQASSGGCLGGGGWGNVQSQAGLARLAEAGGLAIPRDL